MFSHAIVLGNTENKAISLSHTIILPVSGPTLMQQTIVKVSPIFQHHVPQTRGPDAQLKLELVHVLNFGQ